MTEAELLNIEQRAVSSPSAWSVSPPGAWVTSDLIKRFLFAIRERDRLIHVLTQDGSPALDLGKQIGRGECLVAFDEIVAGYANTPTLSTAVLGDIRKALLTSGESIRTPPDRLKDEFHQLVKDIRVIIWRSTERPVTSQIMAEDLLALLEGKGEGK